VTASAERQERIKLRIFLPLIAAIAVLMGVFVFGLQHEQRRANERSIERAAQSVQRLLDAEMQRCTEMMGVGIQAVLNDQRLANGLQERNKDALLERAKPMFQMLSGSHKISHFYFHTPERVNLLRVHDPQRCGDKIEDRSLLEAEQTGKRVVGFEHGTLGSFVLRVIQPWQRDGKLLGYVELGVDFQQILESIHQELGVDLFVAVDKERLRRQEWDLARSAATNHVVWDQFPYDIVVDKTVRAIPSPVQQRLNRRRPDRTASAEVVAGSGNVTQVIILPLIDINGQAPAELIVLRDITGAMAETLNAKLVIMGVCLAVSAGLMALFYVFLGRIETSLAEGRSKLRGEIADRQAAQKALAELNDRLEERVQERTGELKQANAEMQAAMARSEKAQAELRSTQQQLLEASRQAGMAELATSVLHNIGNVLNSVNVSATLVSEQLEQSKLGGVARVSALIQAHAASLDEFFTRDPKGRQVPAYLGQLAQHLAGEQEAVLKELKGLRENIEHIKRIVTVQQSYAKVAGMTETVKASELVEDALRMNAEALKQHSIEVQREYEPTIPEFTVDKHRVLQILMNLIRNALYACVGSSQAHRRLTVRLARNNGSIRFVVADNGVGIAPENMPRIFDHGFTTRKEGHGFGLHSGALAAKEMGGVLLAYSEGPGQGSTFTLELPAHGR
jgi:C4-dicarboxylate-specific signal transduction histidine kinase